MAVVLPRSPVLLMDTISPWISCASFRILGFYFIGVPQFVSSVLRASLIPVVVLPLFIVHPLLVFVPCHPILVRCLCSFWVSKYAQAVTFIFTLTAIITYGKSGRALHTYASEWTDERFTGFLAGGAHIRSSYSCLGAYESLLGLRSKRQRRANPYSATSNFPHFRQWHSTFPLSLLCMSSK